MSSSYNRQRSLAVRCLPALVAAIALCLPSIALAEEAAPGWELSATAAPSSLVQGVDAEQAVTPSPEAASFTLVYEAESTVPVAAGASPAVVQAALESLPRVGADDVRVSEANSEPGVYLVKFVGALGDTAVAELEAEGASISQRTEGAASGTIILDVFNIGAGASSGRIVVTDHLPAGLRARQAGEMRKPFQPGGEGYGVDPIITHEQWRCSGNGPGPANGVAGATIVTCENDPSNLASLLGGGGVPHEGVEDPEPQIGVTVESEGEAAGLVNRVSIAGGGAHSGASTENTIPVGERNQPSGITSGDAWMSNADGTIDDQAGSHPYAMTSVFNIATSINEAREGRSPGGELRNLEVRLPPGFIGNLQRVPQCTQVELEKIVEQPDCPQSSEVGLLSAHLTEASTVTNPIFNMVPPKGEPAEFGFKYLGVVVLLHFAVRSGGDYGITVHANDLVADPTAQVVTQIWGVPADPTHDVWRSENGEACSPSEIETSPALGNSYCSAPQHRILTPILTVPTACGAPAQFAFHELSSWLNPDAQSEADSVTHDSFGQPEGYKGCEDLTFGPSTALFPETSRADEATGLTAEVKPPLGGLEALGAFGSADIQDATVTLPPGFVVNPGQANGLQACSLAAAALTPLPSGEENDGPANCPDSSRLGTVQIKTPLIEGAEEKQIEGNVYLLPSNPPEIKLLAAGSADGVNVKLTGVAKLNEQTGQVTATFRGTPQVPASLSKLSFSGGTHAALVTPVRCGTFAAETSFTPWSSPFGADFGEAVDLGVSEGAGGGACPSGGLAFTPTFTAGSTNAQAGQYTGLSMHLHVGAGQQRIERFQVTLPEGAIGAISHVPLCPEPQAAAGSCPESSQVGHAVVQAGPGSSPLVLPQPGGPEIKIYLTGPYAGAPFGLSIVTPLVAGPFNLGTIVTRAKIEIDPHTARVTAISDPIPQIVKGVPTDVRDIQVYLDRLANFTLNPTDCDAAKYEGVASGAAPPGESEASDQAGIESRSQMTACRDLAFTPKFSASTAGKTSKASGASLNVHLSFPHPGPATGSQSGEANVAKVHVELPKQLPSRLTTLQKACTEQRFAANPATCPPESLVGHAVAHTPILNKPLEGPAYFVSHGGAAFPELVLVLQGEGVTLELHGVTDIKHGITSSTFNQVPDAPVSSFELKLPQGNFSTLAAPGGNLCGQKLLMPTVLTAQDGAQVKQSTPIETEGCAKVLSVASIKTKNGNVTIKVTVPAAGKLSASGKGLIGAAKRAKGIETLTLKLAHRAGKHGGAKVVLRFVPSRGKVIAKTLRVGSAKKVAK
jgi:hypothetical protein